MIELCVCERERERGKWEGPEHAGEAWHQVTGWPIKNTHKDV